MPFTNQITIRPISLAIVLLAELMLVSLGFDASRPGLVDSDHWYGFLSYSGQYAKVLVAILVFSVLGLLPRLPDHLTALNQSVRDYPYYTILGVQLFCFALFVWCTSAIFGEDTGIDTISAGLVVAWLAALVATAGLWLLSLAPLAYWRKLLSAETKVFAAAFLVGIFAWLLARYAQTLWTPLSDLTFRLSAILLNQVYPEIIVNPEAKLLGAKNFVVSIAPQCSGYEGMGLMAIFTGFYLAVFRKDFRFPQALLLFPIGIVTIWLFNSLRIASLIAIGASFSPAVAIEGFHSQAGWISFIIVIILILTLAYRMSFFSRVPAATTASSQQLNLPMATLIPFIVLLAATILTSAMSAGFDWFYPLRVIAVALALAACWRLYRFSRPKFSIEPWIAGTVVFALWILLVPNDAALNQNFSAQLSEVSQLSMGLWLLFRILGAVITVPLAEEMLFRGYLLSRLARRGVLLEGRIAFSWMAYIVSSVLFGLLHANWLAGIAAGLIFGWVRYRSDTIKDAVIAHASANLLLTAYVISTGSWSLW